MHADDSFAAQNDKPARARGFRGHHRTWRPSGISLLSGSIVGIAVWGTLYIFGAAVCGLFHLDLSQSHSSVPALLGLYGCLAACLALFVGAFVASHTANARDRSSGALCGVLMWGMSTITMIAGVFALSLGALDKISGAGLQVVQVGASAIGCLGMLSQKTPPLAADDTFGALALEPTQILWAMLGLIVISLVISVRGGVAGASQQLE